MSLSVAVSTFRCDQTVTKSGPPASSVSIASVAVTLEEQVARDAANALEEVRREVAQARKYATTGEVSGIQQAAHHGLEAVAYLKNLGAPWLAAQDDAVRREVDEAEDQLRRFKMHAIQKGAGIMPADEPPEPS